MTDSAFNECVIKINEALLKSPNALGIELVKEEGRHTYRWLDDSLAAKNVRRGIRNILKATWQAGKYNYQQFADALRVDVLAIRGLIDEDMLREFPHLAK